jgi:hypothetical protein
MDINVYALFFGKMMIERNKMKEVQSDFNGIMDVRMVR